MIQPRSLELFEFLGIVDPVMQRSIVPPIARMYKGPEGVEILKEFVMAPVLESTPDKPYVCEFKYCSGKPKKELTRHGGR
jgi:hypothetical protein